MATTLGNQNLGQVDLLVKKAFNTGARGYKSAYEQVFIVEEPQRFDEKFDIVQTNSAVDEVSDGAAFPTQSIKEVGRNEITQKIYKSALPIGDIAELFDNYGAIKRTAATRGAHFKAKIDTLCADFLNNSTSTSSPYGVTIDGTVYPLFGNSQAIGDTGDTQDNRISGNLDKSTLDEARQGLLKQKDHDGMIGFFQPKRLVVPVEEKLNAWQLTYSPMEPESANNNRNYTETLNISCIEWVQLTSSTACFLLGDQSDIGARGLRLEVKELPTIRRVYDTTTGNYVYTLRMVLQPGTVDYVGGISIGL